MASPHFSKAIIAAFLDPLIQIVYVPYIPSKTHLNNCLSLAALSIMNTIFFSFYYGCILHNWNW